MSKPSASKPEKTSRETPSTLRERRGLRNAFETPLRPISVLRRSVLMPLDFDTDRTFQMLRNGDRLQSDKSGRKRLITTSEQRWTPRKNRTVSTTLSTTSSNKATLGELPFSQGPEMDLVTFLKSTSPDTCHRLHQLTADFATLSEMPAPNFYDHPAFALSPFSSASDCPLLETTSTIEQIRNVCRQSNKSSEEKNITSSSKDDSNGVVKKKSLFAIDTRLSNPSRIKGASRWVSISPTRQPFSLSSAGEAKSKTRISTSSASETPPDEGGGSSATSSGGGIRKFSDFFRTKSDLETLDVSSGSPSAYSIAENSNLERCDLERFLRRTTNTPTFDHDTSGGFPRHPNTGRGWKSRNLKCTTCCEESCGVCQRCCCAFKAAVLALDTHKEGSVGRQEALLRIQEITKIYPYGREVPTFLRCTGGKPGEGPGCGKLVCPDCCGVCPDDICGDIQCRKCKPMMWEECSWHGFRYTRQQELQSRK